MSPVSHEDYSHDSHEHFHADEEVDMEVGSEHHLETQQQPCINEQLPSSPTYADNSLSQLTSSFQSMTPTSLHSFIPSIRETNVTPSLMVNNDSTDDLPPCLIPMEDAERIRLNLERNIPPEQNNHKSVIMINSKCNSDRSVHFDDTENDCLLDEKVSQEQDSITTNQFDSNDHQMEPDEGVTDDMTELQDQQEAARENEKMAANSFDSKMSLLCRYERPNYTMLVPKSTTNVGSGSEEIDESNWQVVNCDYGYCDYGGFYGDSCGYMPYINTSASCCPPNNDQPNAVTTINFDDQQQEAAHRRLFNLEKMQSLHFADRSCFKINQMFSLAPVIRIKLGMEFNFDANFFHNGPNPIMMDYKEAEKINSLNLSCQAISRRPSQLNAVFDTLERGIFYANKLFQVYEQFWQGHSELGEWIRQDETLFNVKKNTLLHKLYHLRGVLTFDDEQNAWAIMNGVRFKIFEFLNFIRFLFS